MKKVLSMLMLLSIICTFVCGCGEVSTNDPQQEAIKQQQMIKKQEKEILDDISTAYEACSFCSNNILIIWYDALSLDFDNLISFSRVKRDFIKYSSSITDDEMFDQLFDQNHTYYGAKTDPLVIKTIEKYNGKKGEDESANSLIDISRTLYEYSCDAYTWTKKSGYKFEDWSDYVNTILASISGIGIYDISIVGKLDSAKEKIKSLPESAKHHEELKQLYIKVSTLFDDIRNPSGSYNSVSSKQNEEISEIKNLISNLSFELE